MARPGGALAPRAPAPRPPTTTASLGCVSECDRNHGHPGCRQTQFQQRRRRGRHLEEVHLSVPERFRHTTPRIVAATRTPANDHFAVPPLPEYAWSRGPETNGAYFDPSETYVPWPDSGTFVFSNANMFATEYDPVFNGAGTIDLTRDFAGTAAANVGFSVQTPRRSARSTANYGFRVFTGMTIPAGTCIRANQRRLAVWESRAHRWLRSGYGQRLSGRHWHDHTSRWPNNTAIGIRYFPATFYPERRDSAPGRFRLHGTPTTPTGLAPDGTVLNRYEIKPANFTGARRQVRRRHAELRELVHVLPQASPGAACRSRHGLPDAGGHARCRVHHQFRGRRDDSGRHDAGHRRRRQSRSAVHELLSELDRQRRHAQPCGGRQPHPQLQAHR